MRKLFEKLVIKHKFDDFQVVLPNLCVSLWFLVFWLQIFKQDPYHLVCVFQHFSHLLINHITLPQLVSAGFLTQNHRNDDKTPHMMLKVSRLVNQYRVEICEIFIVIEKIVADDNIGILIERVFFLEGKQFAN
jgi:hypothetical protein